MIFFFGRPSNLVDLPAKCGEEHDDVVFFCQSPDQLQELDRMKKVENEYDKEYDNGDGITRQIRDYIQYLQHRFMHDQIVDRADDTPEEGIQRTDDPVEIESVVRVIPKPHIQPDDEDVAGDQFDHCHGGNHDQEYQDFRSPTFRIHAGKCDKCHDMEDTESGSVQWKPGTSKESRVHPFLRLTDGGNEMSVEELDDPSAHTPEDKYKSKIFYYIHIITESRFVCERTRLFFFRSLFFGHIFQRLYHDYGKSVK